MSSSALAGLERAGRAGCAWVHKTCEYCGQAHRPRLVVFVMLDSSGSMAFQTGDGEPKASPVRDAVADFYADPASAGLSIAEKFFPILRPEVPDHCKTDADCGAPGASFATPTLPT